MAQPYVGEIRMFAGNFAPAGWMFCEGQLLPISEYETLFNQKRDDAMKRLKGYESLVNDKLAMAEGKKNEIQKKQEDALKKKGQDLLKGLIKK